MRSLVLLVTVVALTIGYCHGAKVPEIFDAQGRSVSSMIYDFIEAMRNQMPEGFPEYGIPSLAPFELKHKAFNLDTGDFSAKGEVEDLVVLGLNEFEIVTLNVNLLRRRCDFEFRFDNLNLTTQYKADMGTGYRVERGGGAYMALETLRIEGTVRFTISLSRAITIRDIRIYITLENAVSQIENLSKWRILNRKMNEVVEEFIMLSINDNTDFMADWMDEKLTPIANDFLGNNSMFKLANFIGNSVEVEENA